MYSDSSPCSKTVAIKGYLNFMQQCRGGWDKRYVVCVWARASACYDIIYRLFHSVTNVCLQLVLGQNVLWSCHPPCACVAWRFMATWSWVYTGLDCCASTIMVHLVIPCSNLIWTFMRLWLLCHCRLCADHTCWSMKLSEIRWVFLRPYTQPWWLLCHT